MSGYQVIARKYRPLGFDEVVGQEAIARTLRNAISADRIAHAYMFCGPRGVGKTSTARILARALNCLSFDAPTTEPCGTCDLCVRATAGEDHDVMEIDAASNRKVDDARNLIANVSFHPTRTRFKVYVVDEVHMLTTEAFNALLKTLEEPPPHVKFIFATTDPQKVPATILSRCQRFDFRPVPPADIAKLLGGICEREALDAEPEALLAIARASVGGVRDAQSLLEQLATLGEGNVRVADLHALLGTVPAERMRGLFGALAAGDTGQVLTLAGEVLDGGTDPGELLRQCMRHAHDLMLLRVQGERAAEVLADAETRRALAEQARSFSQATLVYAVTLFGEALKNTRLLGEGRLFAETTLARLAGHRELRYLDQLARELRSIEQQLAGGPPVRVTAPRQADVAPGTGSTRASPGRTASAAAPVSSEPDPPQPRTEARTQARPEPLAAEPAATDPVETEVGSDAAAEPDDGGDDGGEDDWWARVITSLSGQSLLRTCLAEAQVAEQDGERVVLSFPASQAYQRKTLDQDANRVAVEQAIAVALGHPARVKTTERPDEPDGADESSGSRPVRERSTDRLSAREIQAAREAPLSKLVEKELGGSIVHLERDR